jgi:DNA gyrase subunit A
MQPNEFHRAVLPVREFEEAFIFFATAKGVVKKTPLGAYSRPRNSGIIAMGLDLDDELIGVAQTSGDDEIVLASRNGMAVRFDEKNVRAMGRGARGVKGMDLRGDDLVVGMVVTNADASLLSVCENGYGKRTQVSEYRKTRRGGKGVINIKTTDRNGRVVAIKSVVDTDQLMMITAKGIVLRTDLSALREIGRATQGVRLIRLASEDDSVVAVAKIVSEEDKEDDDNDGITENREERAAGAEDSVAPEADDTAPEADNPDADGAGENEDESTT